jgi:hypothetical protein
MVAIGHFSVEARRREKQKSRERDERLIDRGQASNREIANRNGLFSALDPSKARIVGRRGSFRAA